MSTHTVTFEVNAKPVRISVNGRTTLADSLRDQLDLPGTKIGCEHGVCGACTVLLDGRAVRSCIVLTATVDGAQVTTVEGLSPAPDELSLIQQAFVDAHALQCGYCTPGMLMAVQPLLVSDEAPTQAEIEEAMGGNICRCTGYQQIREAIQQALERYERDKDHRNHGTVIAS